MKHKTFVLFVVITAFAWGLLACGGSAEGEDNTAVQAGKALFEHSVLEGNPGCITCHSLEASVVIVGPSMAGIATTAESKGDVDEFLKSSIIDPDADVTEGFVAGVMPKNWGELLTDEQIDQLLAYLKSLK